MENNESNIELRSDKVRSIIGQIPPWIIRSGITVILFVLIVLLMGSYYFKYPYTITTTVEFVITGDTYIGFITIPANEISKVKKGQEVEIHFERIKNLSGFTFNSRIKEISDDVTISNKIGFYAAKIDEIENLTINDRTSGIARIKTAEISFFERIIKPFRILKKE